jgi:hypothetical protein
MGSYFDGATVSSDPTLARYTWVGATDASASIYETRTSFEVPYNDEEYQTIQVDPLRRFLHTVTCVSGPLVQETLISNNDRYYGYIVEFSFVAASPFVYGISRELDLEPITPIVVTDVPYNLAPYPSAELASGTVVGATNYSTNPSAETNVTGWVAGLNGSMTASGSVAAVERRTDLFSVGVASAGVLYTATAGGTLGQLRLQQIVTPTAPLTGRRYSANLWAAAAITGTAVLTDITLYLIWRDAANVELTPAVTIGTVPASGGAASVKSVLPPATATNAIIRAGLNVASWSAGATIRLYSDALALTLP